MFMLLFLKAGANIGTIISSMQAFRQKKFQKKSKFYFALHLKRKGSTS